MYFTATQREELQKLPGLKLVETSTQVGITFTHEGRIYSGGFDPSRPPPITTTWSTAERVAFLCRDALHLHARLTGRRYPSSEGDTSHPR